MLKSHARLTQRVCFRISRKAPTPWDRTSLAAQVSLRAQSMPSLTAVHLLTDQRRDSSIVYIIAATFPQK